MKTEITEKLEAATVVVRRQWNDYRRAVVSVDSLSDFHWSSRSGEAGAISPRPFLHAYLSCDAIISGELSHSCLHGDGPHRIKICIVKKDHDKATFDAVQKLVKTGY